MKADFKLFHEYSYLDKSDRPQDDQYAAVAAFLSELGPERIISLTQTKLTITVWFWDAVIQEKKIRNDIDRGSKIRVGILNIPTFLPPTPPRKGEAMCGVK